MTSVLVTGARRGIGLAVTRHPLSATATAVTDAFFAGATTS
jgi:NAD(P)-dependent dehydrogenase (short-subunit alcohol dehydrogenase family)